MELKGSPGPLAPSSRGEVNQGGDSADASPG